MSKTILVTGGARSGKSRIAEALALSLGPQVTYIATAQAWDDEMRARIAEHAARRGPEWTTREAPMDLCAALEEAGSGPCLVDCLTLWLTNLILAEADWEAEAARLVQRLGAAQAPVVLVTNEVGMGIVPDNALARRFRDAAGLVNQRVAAAADEVYLAVSGLSMKVK